MNTLLHIIPMLALADREEEEFVTELHRLPEGWWAVGGLALLVTLCWAVGWMYRREGRTGASPRVRLVLALLRCTTYVTLALIFLEPVRVRILRRWVDSYTIVLVDDSSSMDLTDTYRSEEDARRAADVTGAETAAPARRADLAERLLTAGDRQLLHALAANNRIKLYTFAGEPALQATIRRLRERPADTSGASTDPHKPAAVQEVPLKLSATGASTNLERALRRSVESVGSAPIAGVVVFSDGGFNEGATVEELAAYARERRLPVHTVGIGDPSSPRNARVAEVAAPENVFQKDPFAITARLVTQGLEGESVRVQLRERSESDGGEGVVVESRELPAGAAEAAAGVTFERRQERIGRYTYSVEVPLLSGESVADDNSRQVSVQVIDSRLKVLIVAGAPGWDYRYLSRLLQRDDTVDVSCWLQSADLSAVRDGDKVIDHLPRLAEELFTYDVIVLMDPDPEEFDETWARLLDQFVSEHGGGFLYTAARAHTPAFMRQRELKPLHDLLPVTLDPEADLVLNQIGHYQVGAAPVEVPATVHGHPVMQLAGDAVSSRLLWQGVGDIYWHYPALREKPVATVLMRHGDPRMRNNYGGHVLAAVQFVGAGRTGFLAIDGTYRWRRYGEELFDRFWVQWVRYLAEGRLLGGTRRGVLLTERDECALGEAVQVSARLLDERFEPLRSESVAAVYEIEGERREVLLTAQRDRRGWFEGPFVPQRTGAYRISVRLPGPAGDDRQELTRRIRVSRPNLEILRPQMDRAALTALAGGSLGGRYFEMNEVQRIPALIPDLHEELPIRSRPISLWDRAATLAFLGMLLCAEWLVRKLNKLL
ncbi:MAG: VWA domain-containing protein [Planctomycetes bacterium]|nr:VWA domain-containing protein [Planctomycetota bacterium]